MGFSILIVDDSATTRALIKRSVAMADIGVTEMREAGDGVAALEALRAERVDLILADLHMPRMTGVELAHEILRDPALKGIPLAVVSAEPSAQRISALRAAGIKGHLRKPCTPESLRDLISPFVEAAHGRQN
jgi:two-component system chemotaxis response regulator CheY